MEWLNTLFFGNGIAHAVLTFASVSYTHLTLPTIA